MNTHSIRSGLMSDIFTIQESRETQLSLSDDQAESLRLLGRDLAAKAEFFLPDTGSASSDEDVVERTVIRCVAVGGGVYRVRVANAVGSIALPHGSLHVIPKIPIAHFAHIARRSYSEPRLGDDLISVESLEVFWELVAQWCVTSIEVLLRSGLLVDYREFSEGLPMVRGRVNVRQTSQRFLHGRLEADCTFDELDLDHPLNRVLRAAVRLIAGHPLIRNESLSRRASRLDRAMDGIGPMVPGDLRVQLDRRTYRYAEALDLSQRVLSMFGTNVTAGSRLGRTFLIPTPGLIENGIREILRTGMSPLLVNKKGKQISGDRFFSVNPDLVFGHDAVIGDVKYKVAQDYWNRSEVQQAAMFASGFRAPAALIATFACDSSVGDITMQLGDLCIRRIVWTAVTDTNPVDAEAGFIERARAFLMPYIAQSAAA